MEDDPRYHDTWRLLKKYRDVVWSLELSVQQLKKQVEVEYGSGIEDFLESVYAAGLDLNDDEANIRMKMEAIQTSRAFLKMIDDSVEVLRKYHPKGEKYYWILYYTYLSPHQPENVTEILERLEEKFPIIGRINRATYFRWKNEAFREVRSLLWGYEEEERRILQTFCEGLEIGKTD